ncbi:MAG: DNA translocase FtsK, partial [Clostridia bacterium]|nr:DNA translocase FtsK [Clostridia bacterium]
GGTGSGKSSGLNSLLISILYKSSPAEVKFILIDPKLVEFMPYSGIPHLMTPTAITDVNQAINAFKWAEKEMDQRYLKLQKTGVRNIQEYNQRPEILDGTEQKLPYIVIIVDEFASLMLSSKEHAKELDDIIANIAGKARAAGIHLVLATQRPSVNVITGTIKSNLNSRIAFAVASSTDSRIILDKTGAESLLGRGDMLFAPLDAPEETRIQGAYVSNDEIKNVVQFVKENNAGDVDEEFVSVLTAKSNGAGGGDAGSIEEIDPDILKSVCRCLINNGTASGSLITRRFNVGWNRAAKIIEYIESLGFIGPQVGAKGREVIITKEKFEEYFGEKF